MLRLSVFCCALPSLVAAQQVPGSSSATQAIAITHVTVIDVTAGQRVPDQTVVVRGNRVVTVARKPELPRGARTIDGRGKFLIPGLWDMHVHAANPQTAERFAKLFVANGVTGVREMWGDRATIRRWRDWLLAGSTVAPRLVASGHILDGAPPFWPGSATAMTADEGRRAVDSLQADGADFIKVYSRLPREAYFAIAAEAKRRGIPFAGHVPATVTAAEASDAGQRTIEHLTGLITACSSRQAELMGRGDSLAKLSAAELVKARAAIIADQLSAYDPTRCRALGQKFVANRTWQVPTLTVLHSTAYRNDSALTNDPRLRYLPAALVESWDWRKNPALQALSDDRWALSRKLFARQLEIVGELHRAGVPILAGTDVTNPYCLPGFSLHDELAFLVQAGLTPAEALRSATLGPATFLAATDSLGTIAAGKLADLVMLDADPLVGIHNTAKIRGVFANGRYFERAALDSLLATTEEPHRANPASR